MQNLNLKIDGMSCSACVGHVTKALESVAGVSNVSVDLERGSAHVEGQSLDLDELIAAVEEEGYEAQSA